MGGWRRGQWLEGNRTSVLFKVMKRVKNFMMN